MDILDQVSAKHMKDSVSPFSIGDTVRVEVMISEGERERTQPFEGVVIGRRGKGVQATFTVRKISQGIGVERVFPIHSPNIASIKVIRRGRVRRAKLYYLRKLKGKAAHVPEKTEYRDRNR